MCAKSNWLCAGLVCVAWGTAWAADETRPEEQPALAVGELLPAFESVDDQAQSWKSADYVGKKVLVLYFYPGDFTGGCSKQAQAYRDALAKFEALGAELVGVSGDEASVHALFKETYALKHTLLADTNGELAGLLGVPATLSKRRVRAVTPDRKPLLDADGKAIFLERPMTLARWTIVVDRDGKIACLRSIVHPERDSEEVLKIVEALAK